MSKALFEGGVNAANSFMVLLNNAYAKVGSNRSISGCATFYDGGSQSDQALDSSEVTAIDVTDGGQWVGSPTGGTPDSKNCVYRCTTSAGGNAFVNAQALKWAYMAGGIEMVQVAIDNSVIKAT